MAKNLTVGQYGHVLDRLLDLNGWRPRTEDLTGVLRVLSRADSMLELMYILSAIHFLEVRGFQSGRLMVSPTAALVVGRRFPALALDADTPENSVVQYRASQDRVGPWEHMRCERCGHEFGPWHCAHLMLIPQFVIQGVSCDLGIVATNDASEPIGHLFMAAEFDGFSIHKARREKDVRKRRRLAAAGVPIVACYEESHPPQTWFDAVMHLYWHLSGSTEAPANPIDCPGARSADLIFHAESEAA